MLIPLLTAAGWILLLPSLVGLVILALSMAALLSSGAILATIVVYLSGLALAIVASIGGLLLLAVAEALTVLRETRDLMRRQAEIASRPPTSLPQPPAPQPVHTNPLAPPGSNVGPALPSGMKRCSHCNASADLNAEKCPNCSRRFS